MGFSNFYIVSAVAYSFSSVALLATSVWIWKLLCERDSTRQARPKKWVKVGTVRKLQCFPIKSCQGFETETAVLTKLGLKRPGTNIRDRDFVLVNGKGKQLTMVNFPKMALINVEIDDGDRLTLTAPNITPISFQPPKLSKSTLRNIIIKNDTSLKVLDCGDEVATWFQTFLGNENLRLVYHHLSETQRSFQPFMFKCPQFRTLDLGSFHNATSYMMVAEESIQELNTRLQKKCTYKNFRPTIYIDGISEPFGEINWSYVKVGNGDNAILNVAAPCHRCPVITVDQENGILHGDGEPLKTLRNMKLSEQVVDERLKEVLNNKGVMGLRLGLYLAENEGAVIHVGDPVYAALL